MKSGYPPRKPWESPPPPAFRPLMPWEIVSPEAPRRIRDDPGKTDPVTDRTADVLDSPMTEERWQYFVDELAGEDIPLPPRRESRTIPFSMSFARRGARVFKPAPQEPPPPEPQQAAQQAPWEGTLSDTEVELPYYPPSEEPEEVVLSIPPQDEDPDIDDFYHPMSELVHDPAMYDDDQSPDFDATDDDFDDTLQIPKFDGFSADAPISSANLNSPIFTHLKSYFYLDTDRDDDVNRLSNEFIRTYGITHMSDWQESFYVLPPSLQAGHILAALPGQGKTRFAMWATIQATSSYCMHTQQLYNHANPASRNKKVVLWGVPLRMLANQLGQDFEKWYGTKRGGVITPGVGEFWVDPNETKHYVPPVKIIEGAGANSDMRHRRVAICTYEHLLNLLHKYNDPLFKFSTKGPTLGKRIALVVIDEIHEITKPDRGAIIDEILMLCDLLRIRVLAMSGTMPDWAMLRIIRAYPNLFHTITKPTNARRFPIYRTFLKTLRTGEAFGPLTMEHDFLPIYACIGVSAMRSFSTPTPKRLVIFCGTVDDVESVFAGFAVFLIQQFLANPDFLPPLSYFGHPFTLGELLQAAIDQTIDPSMRMPFTMSSTTAEEALYKKHAESLRLSPEYTMPPESFRLFLEILVSTGLLVFHHARIGQSDPQVNVKARIESILSTHFSVCVATTTVAVGVNLAEVSHVFLGPAWVWTADQGEQMIGRCGRTAPGYAIVVKSTRLSTPGMTIGYTAKTEFFLSRIISMCYLKDAIIQRSGSFDGSVRGFYYPDDVLPFPAPGTSARLTEYAISGGYIDSELNVSPFVPQAIILSKNDIRTIPVTVWLLQSVQPSYLLCLTWVILTSYIIPPEVRFIVDKIAPTEQTLLTHIDLGPDTSAITELVTRYAATHSRSDFSDKGVSLSSVSHTIFFLKSFLYAILVNPQPHTQQFGFSKDTIPNLARGLLALKDIETDTIAKSSSLSVPQSLDWARSFLFLIEVGKLFEQFISGTTVPHTPNDFLRIPAPAPSPQYWELFSLHTSGVVDSPLSDPFAAEVELDEHEQ